jgi:benzoylformate decarboxylase
MSEKKNALTVYDATYNLLRKLGLTTMFGNPGSTEQPFLKNFPADFEYVLALQEATAVSMADGFAQATGKPALLNLHTVAGTGNGMCGIMTAFLNKTPLIITAGQQTREMLLFEPLLTNREETTMPKPWVKWAYQPVRPQDVPGAIMRAYTVAVQPPAGPVFVSIPLDDWDQPAHGEAVVRSASVRCSPDPERLALFADKIRESKNPVLLYGSEIERAGGWNAGVRFAERLRAPVYMAPLSERASFPQSHPQFRGMAPMATGPLSGKLRGHDLIIVVGAPVFRSYPYIGGDYLPDGAELLQITNDPYDAATAIVGHSLLGDTKLALDRLNEAIPEMTSRTVPTAMHTATKLPSPPNNPLTALEAFAALSELRPAHAILVHESPSNFGDLAQCWPTNEPDSFYTSSSGGLGWGQPAAIGVAIAQKTLKTGRPVVAAIGDGAFQYSVQSLYTAAQQKLKLIYIVPCNGEYAILKEFAIVEETPKVPALDLPGLDIVATAKAFGCVGVAASTTDEIKAAFKTALSTDGPTVIAIPIAQQLRQLVPDVD